MGDQVLKGHVEVTKNPIFEISTPSSNDVAIASIQALRTFIYEGGLQMAEMSAGAKFCLKGLVNETLGLPITILQIQASIDSR